MSMYSKGPYKFVCMQKLIWASVVKICAEDAFLCDKATMIPNRDIKIWPSLSAYLYYQ